MNNFEIIPSEIGSLELDWYKDHAIDVQSSCFKYDEYDDGSVIPHVSFQWLANAHWFNEAKGIKIATMIEQLRLFAKLGSDISFKTFFFPIKKDGEVPRISEELLEDWSYESSMAPILLETAIDALDERKKIVYQKRMGWRYKIYKDFPPDYKHGPTVWVSARFEFAILPKNTKKIINI